MKPFSKEVGTKQLAYMFDVTSKTIAEWSKSAKEDKPAGWLSKAKIKHGKFDSKLAHQLYIENIILPKYAKPDDDSESMDQAKRRKEIAVANMKELLEQQMRGELIQRDEAVKWVGALVDEAKMAFLALPRRMAPVIYGKDIREGEIILRAEVQRILTRLAKARK